MQDLKGDPRRTFPLLASLGEGAARAVLPNADTPLASLLAEGKSWLPGSGSYDQELEKYGSWAQPSAKYSPDRRFTGSVVPEFTHPPVSQGDLAGLQLNPETTADVMRRRAASDEAGAAGVLPIGAGSVGKALAGAKMSGLGKLTETLPAELVERTMRGPTGGATFSPRAGRFLEAGTDPGRMVATYPNLSRTLVGDQATPEAVREWLESSLGSLGENRANAVGAWKSPAGNMVLDISRDGGTEAGATRLGTQHAERAYFDLPTADSVSLEDEYRPGGTSSRFTPGQQSPALFLDRARTMPSLDLAEQAADAGVHRIKKPSGQFIGADKGIRGDAQLDAVQARRLAQTEQGGQYGGWYEDEGSKPPDPVTGFGGGALYKTNPLYPDPAEYAAHSPQASPGSNLVRHQAVEQGIRQPEWTPERILSIIADSGKLPKSVKPMYSQQVEKHLELRAGMDPAMGPKEGNFALNLGGPEDAASPVSTIDRHEIRTSYKDPVDALTDNIKDAPASLTAHGFMQGENLRLNAEMRRRAAADPGYLESIGWPKYPDGSSYPVDPKGGQAARWAIQKAQTDEAPLFRQDPQAAIARTLADPMNRVSATAPLMAAETRIPEGFDWRTDVGGLSGYDPLYLQKGVRQWPEAGASATSSRPLVVPKGHSSTTMQTKGVEPASKRFLDNREATRALAQGTDGSYGWTFGADGPKGKGRVVSEGQLPLSHEGKGTGVEALLSRLSPMEQAELGPEAFRPVAGFPAAQSPAAAETRSVLQQGGIPGLAERVKKYGSGGLLALPLTLGLMGQKDE